MKKAYLKKVIIETGSIILPAKLTSLNSSGDTSSDTTTYNGSEGLPYTFDENLQELHVRLNNMDYHANSSDFEIKDINNEKQNNKKRN